MFKKKYQEYQQHITAPKDLKERLMEKRKRKKAVPIALVAPLCLLLILYVTRAGTGLLPKFTRDEALQDGMLQKEEDRIENTMETIPEETMPEAAMEGQIEADENEAVAKTNDLPKAIIPPEGVLMEAEEGWILYTDKGILEFTLTSRPAEESSNALEDFYVVDGVTVRVRAENEDMLEILYQAPYFQKEGE